MYKRLESRERRKNQGEGVARVALSEPPHFFFLLRMMILFDFI